MGSRSGHQTHNKSAFWELKAWRWCLPVTVPREWSRRLLGVCVKLDTCLFCRCFNLRFFNFKPECNQLPLYRDLGWSQDMDLYELSLDHRSLTSLRMQVRWFSNLNVWEHVFLLQVLKAEVSDEGLNPLLLREKLQVLSFLLVLGHHEGLGFMIRLWPNLSFNLIFSSFLPCAVTSQPALRFVKRELFHRYLQTQCILGMGWATILNRNPLVSHIFILTGDSRLEMLLHSVFGLLFPHTISHACTWNLPSFFKP